MAGDNSSVYYKACVQGPKIDRVELVVHRNTLPRMVSLRWFWKVKHTYVSDSCSSRCGYVRNMPHKGTHDVSCHMITTVGSVPMGRHCLVVMSDCRALSEHQTSPLATLRTISRRSSSGNDVWVCQRVTHSRCADCPDVSVHVMSALDALFPRLTSHHQLQPPIAQPHTKLTCPSSWCTLIYG